MLTAASLCSGSPWTHDRGSSWEGLTQTLPRLLSYARALRKWVPKSRGAKVRGRHGWVDDRNNHSSLVTVSFDLRSLVVVFSTTNVRSRVVADALLRSLVQLLLQLLLRLLQLLCLRLGSGRQRARYYCFFLFWFTLAPISHLLPLRLISGSLRPSFRRGPVPPLV